MILSHQKCRNNNMSKRETKNVCSKFALRPNSLLLKFHARVLKVLDTLRRKCLLFIGHCLRAGREYSFTPTVEDDYPDSQWKNDFFSNVIERRGHCIGLADLSNAMLDRGGGGGVLGSTSAGYVPLASRNPTPLYSIL